MFTDAAGSTHALVVFTQAMQPGTQLPVEWTIGGETPSAVSWSSPTTLLVTLGGTVNPGSPATLNPMAVPFCGVNTLEAIAATLTILAI